MELDQTKMFVHMEMRQANASCRPFSHEAARKERCQACRMQVILHCEDCKIQVSGCLCTEIENHGELHAMERMRQRGIWLPEWGTMPEGFDGKVGGS